MVLVHHFFVFTSGSSIAKHFGSLAEFCGHGADLFFALSGFLIVRQMTKVGDTVSWLNLVAYYFVAGTTCMTVGWLLFRLLEDPLCRKITKAVEALVSGIKTH
jgi:peptidoglycan/LPS O-acetylase OafA/YrhL